MEAGPKPAKSAAEHEPRSVPLVVKHQLQRADLVQHRQPAGSLVDRRLYMAVGYAYWALTHTRKHSKLPCDYALQAVKQA